MNIHRIVFAALSTIIIAAVAAAALACGRASDPAAAPTQTDVSPVPSPAAVQTATETPAADASPEPTDPPSPVPSGGADSSTLPPAIQILSPAYQEAYRLLPDGEWAQRFIADAYFGDFDYQEWSVKDETPTDILDTPRELDLGDEWKLTRILRDDEEQEWFVEKIRVLDADAARSFEAAQAEEDRIEILRTLFEEGGKDREIQEIIVEWEIRLHGVRGEELAREIESYRDWMRRLDDLYALSPKEFTVRTHELSVCDLLAQFVIGERDPRVFTSGADCDIEAAASAAKQALERRGGQPIVDEDEFRELVEDRERFLRGEFDPPPEANPTLDS